MTRLEKLEALWAWLRDESFEASDINGGDLQDKAVELGLLREVPYDPAKHSAYAAEEWDVQPGDPYLEVVKD